MAQLHYPIDSTQSTISNANVWELLIVGGGVESATLDDVALVRRIAARDTDALGELLRRYQQWVFSSSVLLVRDRGLAEDIALSVFTAAWEQADRYDPRIAKVSTWLLMMARHRSIDALRRGTARREHQHVDWMMVEHQPAPGSTETTVESRLEHENLHKALAGLPPDQAQALALAFLDGYTHQEIAEIVGEPLGTVKSRIRLALKKLRESLKNQAE